RRAACSLRAAGARRDRFLGDNSRDQCDHAGNDRPTAPRAHSFSSLSCAAGVEAASASDGGAMRQSGISRRDRRTLVIGGVAIASALGLSRGAPAASAWRADLHARAERVAEERDALAGAHDRERAIHDSLNARSARLAALDSSLLRARTPAEGAASLAALLEDLASDSKVRTTGM